MSVDSLEEPRDKFTVVGIITSDEFQKCRFIVTKLHASFPSRYESPQIRPMLDVEWEDYFIKVRRRHGNGFWELTKSVIVCLNGELLGDDKALENHISKKYKFTLTKDWYEMGKCHLADYLRNIMSKFRQLAYMTISIKNRIVGTLLFELYNDICPLASENFLNKCTTDFEGYSGTPIHRIMKNSWIQGGGWSLKEKKMPCENYAVLHNRRGVLSTCNDRRHLNNTTQFFVSLAPAPWMDYNYVAFGQLIQGADVLRKIESVATYYQAPKYPIDIVRTGELIFTETPDYISSTELDKFQHLSQAALMDALLGPPRAPSPSMDSLLSLMRRHTPPGGYWDSLGYLMKPEDLEKVDVDKLGLMYFDPHYYLNFTDAVLSTPGSSDITI